MLSQLVYVSARKITCTEQEIEKILEACKRNNHDKDITGVLLYSQTHFVQYLEGEYKKIIGLFDKIKEDNRHKNVVMITSGPLKDRLFPSWQMGAKKFDTKNVTFDTEMNSSEQEQFRSILAGNTTGENKAIGLIKKFFK